ncbi:MAG: YARHG domain-containing protein [Treponema sp.]|uniref:YARHG domain-containing protein n=1 Tax=Treponema sp. TaxID=166 RepID=UPI00298DB5DA|nr:YARHG domain-containing protein [Treponema sp.]MBR5933462.1 YARHG domain-containing protein [Treponema sp.]
MKNSKKYIILFSAILFIIAGCTNKKSQNENIFQNQDKVESCINLTTTEEKTFEVDDDYDYDYDSNNSSDEKFITEKEAERINLEIHKKVQDKLKDPTSLFRFEENFINKVNALTDKIQNIPNDEFKKICEDAAVSEGNDEYNHYIWYDKEGRQVHWKRWDNLGESWTYYEHFDEGVIQCELMDFGTKYYSGYELNGNQFYHKNEWEDAHWFKYNSKKHIIYDKDPQQLEKWLLYDDNDELLYVKGSDGSEFYNEVYESSRNFFGFNTWAHTETNEKGQTYTVKRTLFNNGHYYLFYDSVDDAYIRINDCELIVPFYIPIQIYFLQKVKNERNVELVENAGNYQTYYNFTKSGNKILLDIDGDDQGEISDYTSKIGKNKITISYSILRTYYDYITEEAIEQVKFKCTEVFYNVDKDLLYKTIVNQLYYYIYNKDSDNNLKVVKNEYIPHLKKEELRIARNLIYAKNGYKFKSTDLEKLFSSFDWYDPEYSDSSTINLSQKEIELIELIQQYESM